jgi:hypothetical protein
MEQDLSSSFLFFLVYSLTWNYRFKRTGFQFARKRAGPPGGGTRTGFGATGGTSKLSKMDGRKGATAPTQSRPLGGGGSQS